MERITISFSYQTRMMNQRMFKSGLADTVYTSSFDCTIKVGNVQCRSNLFIYL